MLPINPIYNFIILIYVDTPVKVVPSTSHFWTIDSQWMRLLLTVTVFKFLNVLYIFKIWFLQKSVIILTCISVPVIFALSTSRFQLSTINGCGYFPPNPSWHPRTFDFLQIFVVWLVQNSQPALVLVILPLTTSCFKQSISNERGCFPLKAFSNPRVWLKVKSTIIPISNHLTWSCSSKCWSIDKKFSTVDGK